MRRFLLIVVMLLMPVAASAQVITVRDIIELSKAGLDEQSLIALIEVNPTVFPVDVETLKTLKAANVAPNVITAMIKSGRTPPPPPMPFPEPLQAPATEVRQQSTTTPQVVVIEHGEEPRVREVPVAVPVYVAVPVRRSHRDDGVRPSKPAEVVYWGWGGKLRPDAWKPEIEPQKDAKIQVQKK